MQVGNRIIPKRIHVRIEHIQPSRCREDFLRRVKENDAFKHEAHKRGGECFCWLPCIARQALRLLHTYQVTVAVSASSLVG